MDTKMRVLKNPVSYLRIPEVRIRIGPLGNLRSGVRDTRQVNHRLDIPEQRPPFDRTSQVSDGDNLDRARKNIRRLPHRCPHRMSRIGIRRQERRPTKPDAPVTSMRVTMSPGRKHQWQPQP